MRKHTYTFLSVTPLYVPLNFSLPRFLLPGPKTCFLTQQEYTLLQKILRYRAEGPIMLREETLTSADLADISLLLNGDSPELYPSSLPQVVSAEMTWNHQPPIVRRVTNVSAVFFSKEVCEQTCQDLRVVQATGRFCGISLTLQQAHRKARDSEAFCSCMLTHVSKDVPFYISQAPCLRHCYGLPGAESPRLVYGRL